MRKAAFLDRDGVINIDHAYVSRREDFEWVEGVLDAARKLYEAGYALVVVTNQSGIGRGYYTETDFEALNVYMCRMFEEAGAPLAGIYFCPHHPEKAIGAYKIACTCRKPQPGMILRAAEEMSIDLSQSILFGDKESDMQAAQAAPAAFCLAKTDLTHRKPPWPVQTFLVPSQQQSPNSASEPCLQRCKTNGRAAQKAALPFCLNFCARRAPYDVVPPPT